MTDELKIEDTLDRDFLLFTSVAKTYYSRITNEKDKMLCMQWLMRLCSRKLHGITEKRNRNIFLSHLLVQMQEGEIADPFLTLPNDGTLPDAKIFFDLPKVQKRSPPQIEMTDDFQERLADGRTYVAIRCLPKDRGACAFVAISIDKELEDSPHVVIAPCLSDASKLNFTEPLHELTKTTLEDHPLKAHSEQNYIRNVETTITDDTTELGEALCSVMPKKCDKRNHEVSFYEMLLKQIDDEMKGTSAGSNSLIEFLISRLARDLRETPIMRRLLKLPAQQRHFKLLQILRQKLVLRQQEEKRRYLLMEMEERILAPTRSSESSLCSKQPAEYMWQLAVTKPLPDVDTEQLHKIYPRNVISTFLYLIADDRQAILQKARKRQNKFIDDMRLEVYKEIQIAKSGYNKARAAYREWNEILSTVEKIMYNTRNQVVNDNEVDPKEKQHMLINMIANTKEIENLVIQEAQYGEELIEKILDANLWTFSVQDNCEKDLSWELKSSIESLRRNIKMYKVLIANQKQRIKKFAQKLGYT